MRWKKPDVVLLRLGMNNLTAARPEEYEVDVKSIVAQVGDRRQLVTSAPALQTATEG